jgi:PKD repeat protein
MKTAILSSTRILLVGAILFAAPSTAMAQQQQQEQQQGTSTGETTTGETGPLTPEEREEQNRLQNVTSAITRNLQQGEMEVNGIVYTPRWSNPVWVQPNSLSVLFDYCLPGEFADSGQQILGDSELEVLESYSVALSSDITGWLMVVENEHQTDRIPAAVGVICASDANDIDTRILSEQEQTVIKNVVQQFITIRNIQKTNITQIINIINNITNQTGGGNQTGNQTDGGDGNETLTVTATWEPIGIGPGNITDTFAFRATVEGGTEPYTYEWDFGDGQTATGQNVQHTYENAQDQREYNATVTVTDAAGQTASDTTEVHTTRPGGIEPLRVNAYWDTTDGGTAPATYSLEADAFGGSDVDPERGYTFQWDFGDGQTSALTSNCCEFHTYENPGHYTATVTVTDDSGQTASDSTSFNVSPPGPNMTGALEVGWSSNAQDGTEAPATWCFNADARGGVPPYTSYSWDFGDGGRATGQDVCHTFEQPGTYPVTLTVTDSAGTIHSETGHIEVEPPVDTTAPPTTANETAGTTETTITTTTTEDETTATTPEAETEGGEGGTTTDTTPETPPSATEAGAAEAPPAGTTTEGQDAATIPGT